MAPTPRMAGPPGPAFFCFPQQKPLAAAFRPYPIIEWQPYKERLKIPQKYREGCKVGRARGDRYTTQKRAICNQFACKPRRGGSVTKHTQAEVEGCTRPARANRASIIRSLAGRDYFQFTRLRGADLPGLQGVCGAAELNEAGVVCCAWVPASGIDDGDDDDDDDDDRNDGRRRRSRPRVLLSGLAARLRPGPPPPPVPERSARVRPVRVRRPRPFCGSRTASASRPRPRGWHSGCLLGPD
jgi:hypothetical protein